ncbi:MAG: feruloyl-CoA synthase [Alphaproteobacteria bacterium]|nr:2-succinylbenzoate--CoA ligase [Pseudorhodoplanes sp.]MCQ3943709.1 feruloyl-CoA synthase [Alphaproteobacteria bacterium]GIK81903.1 MAG: feruloyl-CoA synthase [Alphaproteobacteria bacterium]
MQEALKAAVGRDLQSPVRAISYAPVAVDAQKRADGTTILRSRMALDAYEPSLAVLFRAAAESQPDRTFLAERNGGQWRTLTYAQARALVDALAASLIERGLSAERPVMILSGNSIDHALLMLAGFTSGIPVAPVSVAYSLQSQDHAKVRHIAELLDPGLIYVADTGPFAAALAALDLKGRTVVANRNSADLDGVVAFDTLTATKPGPSLDQAAKSVGADTIAKILFTSGSTGLPKGVINTHGMLTANQQQLAQIWPFVGDAPLVLVDWLPWNHTFGANHNFNLVLRHAGTLHIDGGRPLPAMIGETVRNLSEISPTIYFNVPAGYAGLLPHLEKNEAFARSFFRNLRMIFYAGAGLPQDLWERLEAVSLRTIGERIPMTSSWGSTETAPLATAAHFLIDRAGVIGVPIPGVDLKLVPVGAKTEVRVRGPNITPGYWKRDDLTKAAFDEEGFYMIGDAVRLADPHEPARGVMFDGRIAEDFKLTTGTWVAVGALRVGVLAAASPALQDAVIAGENKPYIGMLAWLNLAGCQQIAGADAPKTLAELSAHPAVRTHVRDSLARWNAQQTGSSQRIERVILLPDAPSIDHNEITDKGYINQRLALEHRRKQVEALFATTPGPDVIVVP